MLTCYELLTTYQRRKLAKSARYYANKEGRIYYVTTYRNEHGWCAEIVNESEWITQPYRDEEVLIYTYYPGAARGKWSY